MGPTLAEINVIPLVDVMLVLLIIFMVAAPMLQRGVELKLPQSRQTEEISSERIFVDVPKSFRQDGRVFLGKESIGIKVLAERLRQQMVNRNDKQVFLRGDAELQVQNLIDVLDQLKQAGVANVGIVTELPER
ncbi:MAG TPA: biopolymer transporter ExbD [Vicinamibacterales bacterium]